MLAAVGADSVEEFYADVPAASGSRATARPAGAVRRRAGPRPPRARPARKNRSTQERLSFLGAGTYNHYVPAVVDEVIGRSEFLTAYAGEPYEDHGRFQALFQYQSLMAELLEMDVVNVPTYDGLPGHRDRPDDVRPHHRPRTRAGRERRAAREARRRCTTTSRAPSDARARADGRRRRRRRRVRRSAAR